jgi:small subunit ribosomal protein S30e
MPSHGALSKAGKVRSTTPKIEKDKSRPSPNPRVNNRSKYDRRIILERNKGRSGTQGGQYIPNTRGGFRGRRRR